MRSITVVALIMLGAELFATHRALADALPIPPVPPEHPPAADSAPVPDANAQAPLTAASNAPTFDVKFYRAKPYDPGLGFAPGSRYQTTEDRKPIQNSWVQHQRPAQAIAHSTVAWICGSEPVVIIFFGIVMSTGAWPRSRGTRNTGNKIHLARDGCGPSPLAPARYVKLSRRRDHVAADGRGRQLAIIASTDSDPVAQYSGVTIVIS